MAFTLTCSSSGRVVVEVFQYRQRTTVCRYGKPESEWKRARDTDLVRCAQEWARSEARGTLTGTATQAKQRQLRVYSILSRRTHPFPVSCLP